MGCGNSKSVKSTTPQLPTAPQKSQTDNEAEDEVAVVEADPVRIRSPMNAEHTRAQLKAQELRLQGQQPSVTSIRQEERQDNPDQSRAKASLQFDHIGAAQLNLDELDVEPKQTSVNKAKKLGTSEQLRHDMEDLLEN